MISRAADYRFVDFANGDMPTDKFDGMILPKRDFFSPIKYNALKGEDIAFLYEAARRSVIKSYAYGRNNDSAHLEDDIYDGQKLIPTKRISHDQINDVISKINHRTTVRSNLHGRVFRFKENSGLIGERTFLSAEWIDVLDLLSDFVDTSEVGVGAVDIGDPLSLLDIQRLFEVVRQFSNPVLALSSYGYPFVSFNNFYTWSDGSYIYPFEPSTSDSWLQVKWTVRYKTLAMYITNDFVITLPRDGIGSVKSVQLITHGETNNGKVYDIRTVNTNVSYDGDFIKLTIPFSSLYMTAVRILNYTGLGTQPTAEDAERVGLSYLSSTVLIRAENDEIKF